MLKTTLDEFVTDCIARNQDADGLTQEELYGLYLSWCSLRGSMPAPARSFRAGLRAAGIQPARGGGVCTGLVMTGPAACDYIVHRELPLVALPEAQRNVGSVGAVSLGREPAEGNGPVSAPAA
jgi:hypothetical protein